MYKYGGLKYYLKAVKEISRLESEEKKQASEYFNDEYRELKVGRACFGRCVPLLSKNSLSCLFLDQAHNPEQEQSADDGGHQGANQTPKTEAY